MSSKLEEDIEVLFDNDSVIPPRNLIIGLSSLIEDVAIKFANWSIVCELKMSYGDADELRHDDNKLFYYFINNIYGKQSHE